MIIHATPYRADKNIGRAYNEFIESLNIPDDTWIVLRDGDTMFLTPDWGRQIEEVAATTHYDLLGCMTNRLRGQHQMPLGFDTEGDLFKMYEYSIQIEKRYWGKTEPAPGVAGLFFMFKKSLWKKVGGFEEGTIYTDTEFNKSVMAAGGNIGLMSGLFLVHGYRLWERNYNEAWQSKDHLK